MRRRIIGRRDLPDADKAVEAVAARQVDVDRDTIRAMLAVPVDSEAWQAERDAAEAPVDEP